MSKILISTITDYDNYGNRLQNYALQEVLKGMGHEVETLKNQPRSKKRVDKIKFFLFTISFNEQLNFIKRKFNRQFKKRKKVENLKNEVASKNRQRNFMDFTYKYIKETNYTIFGGDTSDLKKDDYDFFITGSDQVWNPTYRFGLALDFLQFAPKNRRIAYAPSFGVNVIEGKYKKNYKKWINEIQHLSVREHDGAKVVKDLTGRNVPVLADPTLILPKEQWIEVSKKANNRPDTPYLLTYFLGGPSKETRRKLKKIAQKKNMTIINLGDITEQKTYQTGPSEFLDYINNASAFFTDSFHGVVFSIIFQTPFVVYERQSSGSSMYSRIETILDNFDMRNREANGFNEDIFTMDFSGTYEVIEREYNKSIKYLKEALRIEE